MQEPEWNSPTMKSENLREFLEEQVERFNRPDFIPADPISIPHQFSKPEDIEIAGLIAAVFSWGNRTTIIRKSNEFLAMMDLSPHDFLMNHTESDLKPFTAFVHRTFQPTDALYFIHFLSNHFKENRSLETLFLPGQTIEKGLTNFNKVFFNSEIAPNRTKKHIPTPERKSTCKRLNMYLRWMVRQDNKGVDFGIWKKISPADLMCPIDVHVANISRQLGLLLRTQNDWLAVKELTNNLKLLDAGDPVKYDFALFGIGISGGIGDILDR